ncbi:CP2 transcription factor-domain-containing protein [Zychaea mexicana]|uniref:CP2 transcription factor-domain-containing protein n=1 Tax=Zychaea mexicana TaxID=64656 RepID=UPI0022FE4CDF|nr:CP2 transcription factor-domain-containing protein [Zychaea mexicana]KAI9499579.1 CP2 transcription factor-domain-containing protein [Zychaea mexicana]
MMDQRNANMLLRCNIILQASTAATQISEGSPTTYLNRGQAYAIHLQDTYEHDINITSTFIIMFHEPSHRKVALNYWKFWLGQQKNPTEARAVTLDQDQSVGIHNIRFPSFDRITFDWNGRYGAKVFVRFNCLSTDFSRIKGVKGIPLRAQMETKTTLAPPMQTPSDPHILANTLHHQASSLSSSSSASSADNSNEYIEQCYCKIKLFRDKGAERKNKDDAKQIGKHLERVYAEGNPRQHPFWLMYNQPKPFSVFSEIPTTPQASDTLFSTAITDDQQDQQQQQQSSQISLFQQVNSNDNSMNDLGNMTSTSPNGGSLGTMTQYTNQQQATQLQHKRSYSQVEDRQSANIFDISATVPVSSLTLSDNSSSTTAAHITATTTATTTVGLSLYVNVKTTQHQRFHSSPTPTATSRSRTDKKKLQHIVLEHVAVQELIAKLCPVLSLHHSQVSEVLWRQPKSASTSSTVGGPSSAWDSHGHHRSTTATSTKAALARANGSDSTLVRVDDKVLATGFANDTVVGVEWEIKSDGTVRLLLQQ